MVWQHSSVNLQTDDCQNDVYSSAKQAIRQAASSDVKRHGGPAGDLDLTYITPKLIAMSSPAEVSE